MKGGVWYLDSHMERTFCFILFACATFTPIYLFLSTSLSNLSNQRHPAALVEVVFILQGLGRNFLRHLRRTRLLVHVVDAAANNPVNDYRTVKEVYPLSTKKKKRTYNNNNSYNTNNNNNKRKKKLIHIVNLFFSSPFLFSIFYVLRAMIFQELRMYNPEYLERPYIVVLNKIDLPQVCGCLET